MFMLKGKLVKNKLSVVDIITAIIEKMSVSYKVSVPNRILVWYFLTLLI